MKTKYSMRLTVLALAFASFNASFSVLRAQGDLAPPGPPAPAMKTLDQIEPRTPISSVPFTIANPGSYYLTTNITVSNGTAVTIATNGVTLDLNGFTISSTEASPTGTGILLAGAVTDIIIRNGHINGQVAYSGGNYVGSGFANGIEESGSPPVNVRIAGVTVSGCLDDGIVIGSVNSTIVESCNVWTVGGYGIEASSVSDSTAKNCGNAAISADTASDSSGSCTGGADGIDATFVANNCAGSSINGIGVNAAAANSCYGSSLNGDGIDATTAQSCSGYAFGAGAGINASYTAENCYGNSASGDGIDAQTVLNSYGAGGGNGVYASKNAQNCSGVGSGSGAGVRAGDVAESCYGSSSNGNGVNTMMALNCYGTSDTSVGLYVATAQGCYGECTGNSAGIVCWNALNCYGVSAQGFGISATTTVIGCYGQSGSSAGISALVANSSVSNTGNSAIGNTYNMP